MTIDKALAIYAETERTARTFGYASAHMAAGAVLAAEVRRLRGKLPTSADGVTLLWGDCAWSRSGHKATISEIAADGIIGVCYDDGSGFWRDAKDFCSTLEAAEAAEEG